MGKPSSLSRNAFSNIAAYLVSTGISFFLSPFIVRTLGNARYGAWTLIAELIGYYGLLDLGIRGAVTYYVARHAARHEHEELKQSIASAFWAMAAAGGLAAAGGCALAFAFPRIFARGDIDPAEAFGAIVILSCTIGMSLPMEVFAAVLVGYERFDVVNCIDLIARLLTALGILLALKAGGGLIALSLVQASGRALTWTVMLWYAAHHTDGFSLRPKWFRLSDLKKLAAIGSNSMVMNIAQIVINRMDLLVVGAWLGMKWVAYYSIGRMLVEYASAMDFNLVRTFTPRLTAVLSRHEPVEELFLFGVRVSCLLSTCLVACLLSFGRPFIRLWMGPAYVTGSWTERSDAVMAILLLACLPRYLQSMSRQLMYASGRFRYLMWVSVCEAAANFALSVCLVRPLGIAGVALGTLIPAATTQIFFIPAHVFRRFGISARNYIAGGIGRPLTAAVSIFALTSALVRWWEPRSWPVFFVQVCLSSGAALGLAWMVGVSPRDRDYFQGRVLSVVRRRFPEASRSSSCEIQSAAAAQSGATSDCEPRGGQ